MYSLKNPETVVNKYSLQEIKKIHSQFLLYPNSSNSLLHCRDDFLDYFLALLNNQEPVLPAASTEQWISFLSILGPHSVLPLVYWQIKSLALELHPPEEVTDFLRRIFLTTSAQYIKKEEQLSKIIRAFNSEGIPLIVLKGLSFTQTLYPEPGLRPCSDIDLLVEPEFMKKSYKVFESLGYQRLEQRFDLFREFHCEERFIHAQDKSKSLIDFHWGLHPFASFKKDEKLEDLSRRAVRVSIGSLNFYTLSSVDTLIQAAVHLALLHNRSIRLIWIYDIARLIERLNSVSDWRLLQKRSVEWGACIALENCLKMAHAWFGINPPEELGDFSCWPKGKKSEQRSWYNCMNQHKSKIAKFKLYWPAYEGIFKKIRFLLRLIFPSPKVMRQRNTTFSKTPLFLSYFKRWLSWLT